jgi:hypothetical protein
MAVGGISMVIAGILNFVVKDRTEETANETIDDIMITEKTPTTYS